MSVNITTISGRLVRDPEPRTIASGDRLAKFTIAVDNYGKDKGASYFDCVAFRKDAEYVLNYITKGRLVLAVGRYESNKGSDGKTYWTLSLSQISALDKPKDGATPATDTYEPFADGEYA
jgi:single-stranded DNA-binding protein